MVEVVVGALVRDARVLLGHRRADKHAYPGVWDLPGGVVEAGESELEALVRELREELGVGVARASATPLCTVTVRPAGEPVRLSAWRVREWRGEPVNAAPEEHDDLRWFGIDDLPPLVHPDVRAAVVDVLRGHLDEDRAVRVVELRSHEHAGPFWDDEGHLSDDYDELRGLIGISRELFDDAIAWNDRYAAAALRGPGAELGARHLATRQALLRRLRDEVHPGIEVR